MFVTIVPAMDAGGSAVLSGETHSRDFSYPFPCEEGEGWDGGIRAGAVGTAVAEAVSATQ